MEQSPSSEANSSSVSQETPTFYGTWSFITAFIRPISLSLYWTRSILSMLPHPISWRSILVLSSHLHLGLPCGLFPSGFSTKTLYALILSSIHATYYFLKVHFSIILPSTPRPSMRSLSLRFFHKNRVCTYPLLHTCYIPVYLILHDLIARIIFYEE